MRGRNARATMAGLATVAWLALVATAATAQQPPAGDPAKLAAARELLMAQGGIEQARKGLTQMTDAIVEQVRRVNPSEADGLAQFMKTYVEPSSPRVTTFFEGVLEDSIAFYAERCSLEEIKAMTAFLATPAGRKFTALAPEAASSIAPRFVAFQQAMLKDVQAAIARGELGKR